MQSANLVFLKKKIVCLGSIVLFAIQSLSFFLKGLLVFFLFLFYIYYTLFILFIGYVAIIIRFIK